MGARFSLVATRLNLAPSIHLRVNIKKEKCFCGNWRREKQNPAAFIKIKGNP